LVRLSASRTKRSLLFSAIIVHLFSIHFDA